ncbi:MAG TPA: SDR family oxidoreductase [Anaerolineales bacterium]|jgi:NAD(P)-dependent dehydrogenase (short-subunit alcohol dehydrogenase family)|nr:SDR family oxidoreductase [Anaerolineales bacterium]
MKLKDKVVIIAGASEGIGRATALRLAAEGAKLAIAARTRAKLETLAEEIRAMGQEVLIIPTDMTNPEQANTLIKETVAAFGRVDILVNNIGRGLRKPFVETTDEEWQRLVAENLSTTIYGCRAVLPQMEDQREGLIINMASRSGRVGEANLAAYSAVKHGVIGLTKALAAEEGGKGVRVNAICPGPVRTERMDKLLPNADKSNWLTPEDVAAAVLFMVTSPGRTMQGQALEMF